jgi:uncharacterized protein (DUF433 family)
MSDSASWAFQHNGSPAHTIRAFSADHVIRLTGLSRMQLSYWDRTKFFEPHYAFENRRSPNSRVYSFRDVVGLRTLSVLRKFHKIALQKLRRVAKHLSRYNEAPWSELVLYVFKKDVYFREPETESVRDELSGQYTHLRLESIIQDVSKDAERLKHRTQDQIGRIERRRYVAHRAWLVAGTRIPTKAVWNFTQAGYSPQRIIREYPLLTEPDVLAALEHEEKLAQRA